MAPRHKPTALRILHGDEKRYINDTEPQPSPGVPEPPEPLPPQERAVWNYIVSELATMDLAKRPDRDQLYAYVCAVCLHANATVAVRAGGVLIKDRDHELHQNPAIRVQNQAARTMLAFAREFGLTPSSRVQFGSKQIADDYAERLLS